MKVKDLQKKLSELDPESDLLCYSEDESLQTSETVFRVFEIDSLDVVEAEKSRTKKETPTLILEKTKASTKIVLLNITLDF
jgi:hypothetical protein